MSSKPIVEDWREEMKIAGQKKKITQADMLAQITALAPPTLAQIRDAEAIHRPWFFESIVPAGAFLFTGRSKVGKSWLLMQLALAAASCGTFLGFAALGRFDVLYIASEDDIARIKSRVTAFGIPEFPPNVQVITRKELGEYAKQFAPYMSLTDFLRAYLSARPNIKVVILDTESTIRMAWNHETPKVEEEKSVTRKDYAEVSEMDALAIDLGLFLALVNHTSKRKAMQWLDIHETINRTNTAMAGASGSFVISDPPDKDPNDTTSKLRVLGIRGRDINDEYMFAIEQREGNPEFFNLGPYTAHAQTQAELEILDGLADIADESSSEWFTAREIAEHIGKKAVTVQRAISRMMKKGPVTHNKRRVETRKKMGIRFAPEFNK